MALEVHVAEFRARDQLSGPMAAMGRAASSAAKTTSDAWEQAGASTRRFNVDRAALGAGLRELQGVATEFARSAADEAAGQERLQQALANSGVSYEKVSRQVDGLIERGIALSFADDQVVDALTRLTTITGDSGVAMENLGLAMDFARARNISLASASDLVGKVAAGNTSLLSRYGIVLQEGATSAEALALMQQRVAGQSEQYANSVSGTIDRISNSVSDFGENLFSQNQQLQLFLSLMPGVNASYSILAGLIAGAGGIAAVGPLAGAAAVAAGAGIFAYDLNANGQNAGGSTSENLWSGFSAGAAGLTKKLTPGSIGDALFDSIVDQYRGIIESNEFEEAASAVLLMPRETNPEIMYRRLELLLGYAPGQYAPDQIQAEITNRAMLQGLTKGQYLLNLAANNPNFVVDPMTGTYLPQHTAQAFAFERTKAVSDTIANSTTSYVGSPGTSGLEAAIQPIPASPEMRMGPVPNAGDLQNFGNFNQAAEDLAAYRAELQATYGAYAGMVEGLNSATDAQDAFWQSQQNLMGDQRVYSQQQNEYQSQMSALEQGYAILQARQAAGIPLTKEEQDLLNNYPELYGRLEGGSEDAAVAQALLAAQYAENMQKGDELNRTLAGNTDATGDLVDVVNLLILSLDGVPSEVRTQILLDMSQADPKNLALYKSYLDSIPRDVLTTITSVYVTSGTQVGGGAGGAGLNYNMHGGMIPAAAHGRVVGGPYTLVGDGGGPELMIGGQGGMVLPASATRLDRRGQQGRGDTPQMVFPNATFYITPQTADLYGELHQSVLSQYRGG